MFTSGRRLSARLRRVTLPLVALLVALLLAGCAAAQQELAAAQGELTQARDQLAAAQAEVAAQQTAVPQLRGQLATVEAQAQARQAENESLNEKLTAAQAQIAAHETAVAGAQAQLSAAQEELAATAKELEEVKNAPDRLLAQAEAALPKNDLKAAQRIAAQLAEQHPGSPQAARAAEIVTLIEKAAAEQAAAEQARIAAATSKMRTEKDEVRGITFYYDKSTTPYRDVNSFHLYIGKDKSGIWMLKSIQYQGDDWLFIENYVVKADDERYDIAADYFDVERDNSGGAVWEWYDARVTRTDLRMIRAIIASQNTTLRYNGQQYYWDRQITAAEKKALQNVLDAFVALGGDLDNP
jgi:hypothetical protein